MGSQRRLLPLLVFCPLLLGTVPVRSTVRFAPLDGGRAAVQGVHVLALAISPDGTLYAGGRDTYDPRTPTQPNPYGLGSVFMVSHDHGAHWTKSVSEEPPPGYVAHYPAWTDHTRWPANFTVFQLVVNPSHPATIYAAGGSPVGRGSRGQTHLLLRSTNGGRSWTEILIRRVNLNATPPLVTNIVVTATNRQDLTYRRVHNVEALVIDPHNPRHLYAGTDELGVLRSTDGGVSWQYNPASPSVAPHVTEQLVLDPRHPATLYALIQDTRLALLYRSDDDGTQWRKVWQGDYTSNVFLEGGAVYLARNDGIFVSSDRGLHWHLAADARTLPGFAQGTALDQALYDQRGKAWYVELESSTNDRVDGLYASTTAGTTWSALWTKMRGAHGWLSGAVTDNGVPGLWLDNAARPRILFSASAVEGLFRWSVVP